MPPNKCKSFGTGRTSKDSVQQFIGAFTATATTSVTSAPTAIAPPPPYRPSFFSPMTVSFQHSSEEAENGKRTAHNALERQRREGLNTRFQQLAHALPSLQTIRRPSKSMIVAKSVEFVSGSMNRETNYQSQIQNLLKENEKLRKQARRSCQNLQRRASKTRDPTAVTRAKAIMSSLTEKGNGVTLSNSSPPTVQNLKAKKRHTTPPREAPPLKKECTKAKKAPTGSTGSMQYAHSSGGVYSPETAMPLPLPLSHTEDHQRWPSPLPFSYQSVESNTRSSGGGGNATVVDEDSETPYLDPFSLIMTPGQGNDTASLQVPTQSVHRQHVPHAPLPTGPVLPVGSGATHVPHEVYYYPVHDFSNTSFPLENANPPDIMPPFHTASTPVTSHYVHQPARNTAVAPITSNDWTL